MYTSNQVIFVLLCACITAIFAVPTVQAPLNTYPICTTTCNKKNTTLPLVAHIPGDNYCDPNLSVRDILGEFYDALGGPNWYDNSEWLTGSDYCDWEGIVCNNGGTIQTIDLHNNNLIGDQIPPSLGCITTLKSIVLDNNFISGQIPQNFCNLKHIQYLTLPHNNLGGVIPACFSELVHLMHLYLHYNGFIGQLPDFSKFTNIKEIHVQGNCLVGNVPQYIPSKVVIDFNFTNNYFSGCIPSFYQNIIVDFHGNPGFCEQEYIPCFYSDEFFMCPTVPRTNVAGPFNFCGSTAHPVYCLSIKD